MTPRILLTSITLVLAVLAGVLVLVNAPAAISAAFVIGAASLALSMVALLGVIRSVTGRPRGSAGVWLGAAPIPVAMLWAAGAFVQTMTASFWSWKLAVVAEAFGAAATLIVTMVAGAVAGHATASEYSEAGLVDASSRVRAAAERCLLASRGSRSKARVDAVVTRILHLPRAVQGDPFESETFEGQLERLTQALSSGDEAEVEAGLASLEGGRALARVPGGGG